VRGDASKDVTCAVAPTPWGTGGHVPPTFTNGWAQGAQSVGEQYHIQETGQTVLTIT